MLLELEDLIYFNYMSEQEQKQKQEEEEQEEQEKDMFEWWYEKTNAEL